MKGIYETNQLNINLKKMWTIIILIAGIVIYFQFFYKETKSKNSAQKNSSTQSSSQYSEGKKPGTEWVFKREIDQPGVPTIINNYRKVLNGYDYKKIVRSLKGIAKIENEVQRNLGYLTYIEPLAELERKGCFEMFEDIPNYFFDEYLHDVFTFFNEYYPAIGARGQLKNLEDVYNFIPELNGMGAGIDYAEFEAHDEILKTIKKNGIIYAKDMKMMESFNRVNLKEYLINRMLSYNVLEKGKEGKYVIYKIKS